MSGSYHANAEAKIEAIADSGQSGSNAPTHLDFYTKKTGVGPGASPAHQMRVWSGGNVQIYDGDLVVGTGGHGISFAADGNASGMTNELFDDYEEGTWTPIIAYQYGSVTSYTSQVGKYTKIGNMVYADFSVRLSDKGNPSGSYSYLQGLPYNHSGSTAGAGTVYYLANFNYNVSYLSYELGGATPGTAWLTGITGTQGSSTSYINGGYYTNTTWLAGQLVYRVSG